MSFSYFVFFFFNDTATTEIYTLSLHDALPIYLSKTFGDFEAVKRINLEVKYGEVYGLLGANGAGKTTTIKMLCGLLEPTDGEAKLAGETGSLRSGSVGQRIGYMVPEVLPFYDLTT